MSYYGQYYGHRSVSSPSPSPSYGHHGHRSVAPSPSYGQYQGHRGVGTPSGDYHENSAQRLLAKNPELQSLRESDPALFDEVLPVAIKHATKATRTLLADYNQSQRGMGDIATDMSFQRHLPTAVNLASQLLTVPGLAEDPRQLEVLLPQALELTIQTAQSFVKRGDLGDEDASRDMIEALADSDDRGFFADKLTAFGTSLDNASASLAQGYNNAKTSVTNFATQEYNAAKNYATQTAGRVQSFAAQEYASAKNYANQSVDRAKNYATQEYNAAKNYANQGVANAKKYVASKAYALGDSVSGGQYGGPQGGPPSAQRDFEEGEDRGMFQNLFKRFHHWIAPIILRLAKRLCGSRKGRCSLAFPVYRRGLEKLAPLALQGAKYVGIGTLGVVGTGLATNITQDAYNQYLRPHLFPSQVPQPTQPTPPPVVYQTVNNNTNYSIFGKRSVMLGSIAQAVMPDMIADETQGHVGAGRGFGDEDRERTSETVALNIPKVIEMAEQHYRQKRALGTTTESEGQYLQRVLSTAVPALIEEGRYGGSGERGFLGFLAKIIF